MAKDGSPELRKPRLEIDGAATPVRTGGTQGSKNDEQQGPIPHHAVHGECKDIEP